MATTWVGWKSNVIGYVDPLRSTAVICSRSFEMDDEQMSDLWSLDGSTNQWARQTTTPSVLLVKMPALYRRRHPVSFNYLFVRFSFCILKFLNGVLFPSDFLILSSIVRPCTAEIRITKALFDASDVNVIKYALRRIYPQWSSAYFDKLFVSVVTEVTDETATKEAQKVLRSRTIGNELDGRLRQFGHHIVRVDVVGAKDSVT